MHSKGKDGLNPNAATANKLLEECIRENKLDVAKTLGDIFKQRRIAVSPELQQQLASGQEQIK